MMKKLIALAVAALMLAAVGCVPTPDQVAQSTPTPDPDAAPTEVPEVEEPVTLNVWYAVSGTSGETFVQLAEEFDAANDLVDLELSYSGNSSDTATKVSAALLTDTAPDVALMYAGPLYTGGRGDYTIQSLIEDEDFHADDIYAGMWDYCTYMDGGVCAVPYGISTQVLYYNKDILEAAGVDMTNPPATWEELREVCRQCIEKGNVNNADEFIGFEVSDAPWLFKSMLMQNGCAIIESNDGQIVPIYNDAQALEVAEYWKSLVDEGIMPAGEHNNAENKFLSGNCAFIAASSNRISRWPGATEFEIGAIEMPTFGESRSLALGGNVLVILTQDPQRVAAAWEFIKAMTTTENITTFSLATGYLPIRRSSIETEQAQQAIADNEMYAVAFQQLDYTWAYVHFEQMGTMDIELRNALNKIEKEAGGTIQEVLDKAVDNLAVEIAEG